MSAEEIKIVHIDDDLVVVNKPASIPVRIQIIIINLCQQIISASLGPSLRSIPAQHRRIHSGQRARTQEPSHNPSS